MTVKIQIRSFVKGGNHGQYLQALGLKTQIKSLLPDSKVSHLNYQNHFWKELYIQARYGMLPKYLVFRYFWGKNFIFTGFAEKPDISIYGADMIWHLGSDLFPIDEKYFGYKDSAKCRIAYAPSAGFRIANEPEWISGYLDKFTNLGVRDNQTAGFVETAISKKPKLVIDPCFFLIDSEHDFGFSEQQRHAQVSVYGNFKNEQIEQFLRKTPEVNAGNKLEALYLGYYPLERLVKHLLHQLKNPLWVVRQIAQSRLLVTSTFHGVMMALMTNTPFIAILTPNLTARLDAPIAQFFDQKRLVSNDQFNNFVKSDMTLLFETGDFKQLELKGYIDQSRDWLAAALSECL